MMLSIIRRRCRLVKKLLSIMVAFVVLFSASALSFEDLTGEVVKNYMHSCQNVQLARGESVTVFAGLAYETVLEAQEIRSSSVRVTANGKDVTLRHGPHEILDSGAAIKVLFSDTSEKTQYTDVTRNSAVLEVCAFPEDEVKEALCHVPVEFKAGETQTICHADITFLSARPFMALLRVGGSDVELEVELLVELLVEVDELVDEVVLEVELLVVVDEVLVVIDWVVVVEVELD